MTSQVNTGNLNLDQISSLDIPSDPDGALALLKDIYKQAEQNALEREIMSLIHKMIMDAIKKIGQAAS